MSQQAPFYVFTAFILCGQYLQGRATSSAAVMEGSRFIHFIPLFGHISDRIGRKKMYLIGAALMDYSGPCISPWWTRQFHRWCSLPSSSHSFPRHAVRTAGASLPRPSRRACATAVVLGYQFASIIAGGPAPIIATALFAAYQTSFAVAIYIAACAIVGRWRPLSCPTTPARIYR
jgi:MFS family permease